MNESQNYRNKDTHFSRSPTKDVEHVSESEQEFRVTWANEKNLFTRKYFQKNDKPTVTLSEQEIIEKREEILKTISGHKKLSTTEQKNIDNISMSSKSSFSEKSIWEVPKSGIIRNLFVDFSKFNVLRVLARRHCSRTTYKIKTSDILRLRLPNTRLSES